MIYKGMPQMAYPIFMSFQQKTLTLHYRKQPK